MDGFGDYIEAARRQVEITGYHARRLDEILDSRQLGPGDIDIDVQAHFDGAVSAVVAAHDKTTEALLVAAKLSRGVGDTRDRDSRIKRALALLGPDVRENLGGWRNETWDDIHDLRVRIVHHTTRKRMDDGVMRVYVIRPDGLRELREYAEMAAEHARALLPVLDLLEPDLERIASEIARA